jgi:hypothetical protein
MLGKNVESDEEADRIIIYSDRGENHRYCSLPQAGVLRALIAPTFYAQGG